MIAIVEATAPDVQAQAAAITFRMWHTLPSDAARRLLFAEFAFEGKVVGLLEAIALVPQLRSSQTLPRLLMPTEAQGSSSLYATMEPALILALADALRTPETGTVLNAW